MTMQVSEWICEAASGPQLSPEPIGCLGHRAIPHRCDLIGGQGPIRGAEPQRKRQRLSPGADLLTAVEVEQPDGFQQVSGAVAQR